MIKENLKIVHSNIEKACENAARSKDDIVLIDVSKTKPVEMLKEAYDFGERDFGENKVQEIMEKYDCLPHDIRWHMIGHLQTNKVKYIADKVYMIHSVESEKLAREISKQALKFSRVIPILIEINIGDEDSKFGVAYDDCIDFIKSIANLPGISIEGLMTVAPIAQKPEDNRGYFSRMRQLSVDITEQNIDNVRMNILSMGMTGDYMVAIEEGATHVRVGTGIFGERQYAILE